MAGQRRLFIHTVHKKHLGDAEMSDETFVDIMGKVFESLIVDQRLRYVVGQYEICPDTGRLHGQLYSEWFKSLRITEVIKVLPSHVELKSKKSSRTECRNYAMKEGEGPGSRAEQGLIGEFACSRDDGKFRFEEEKVVKPLMKELALDMLVRKGLSPQDIALENPEVYFTHYNAIIATHNARMGVGL